MEVELVVIDEMVDCKVAVGKVVGAFVVVVVGFRLQRGSKEGKKKTILVTCGWCDGHHTKLVN